MEIIINGKKMSKEDVANEKSFMNAAMSAVRDSLAERRADYFTKNTTPLSPDEIECDKKLAQDMKAYDRYFIRVGRRAFSFTRFELMDLRKVQMQLMSEVSSIEFMMNHHVREVKEVFNEAEYIQKELDKVNEFLKEVEPVRVQFMQDINNTWHKITKTLPQWKNFIQDHGDDPLDYTTELMIQHNVLAWTMAKAWQDMKDMGVDKMILKEHKWFKPIATYLTVAYKDMKKLMKGQ